MLAEHRCWILSDEVYSELLYDAEHDTIAAHEGLLDRTILARRVLEDVRDDGLAARLRGAAGAARRADHAPVDQLGLVHARRRSSSRASPRSTGPRDEVDAMRDEFRRAPRRGRRGLNALPGVSCATPARRVLRLPEHRGTGLGSKELADRLLDEAGVAVLAGTAFGAYGEGYLRLSYANSLENIELALAAIGDLLGRADAGDDGPARGRATVRAEPLRGRPRRDPRTTSASCGAWSAPAAASTRR